MEIVERKEFNRKLVKIVVPIALQQLMIASVSVTDALMMGFLNQDSLSAVSLAGQVQFVFSLFMFAIMAGVSIFSAQYWGINNRRAVEKTLGIGLKWGIIISVPFTIAALLIPELLMKCFASDASLIEKGAEYLKYVGLSYFMQGISMIYLAVMKNCGQTVMCSVISGVSVLTNIFFNFMLIFGIGPFPEMGIAGAAVATVISKLVELLWALAVMLRKSSIKIRLAHIIHNDPVLKKDYWKYTLPFLGNEIVWGGGFMMYSVIMGHLGSDSAAANSIANIVKNLAICVCTGIANASGILIGGLLGRGELSLAKKYGGRLVKVSIISGVISGIIILFVIPFVPLFTSLTATAQRYLRIMLIVCSYYVIGKAINMTTIGGFFPAGGDSKFGFKCDAITMWAVTVPLGIITAFMLGVPPIIVYVIINIDEIIKLPAVFKHYKKYQWVRNLTKENV